MLSWCTYPDGIHFVNCVPVIISKCGGGLISSPWRTLESRQLLPMLGITASKVVIGIQIGYCVANIKCVAQGGTTLGPERSRDGSHVNGSNGDMICSRFGQ